MSCFSSDGIGRGPVRAVDAEESLEAVQLILPSLLLSGGRASVFVDAVLLLLELGLRHWRRVVQEGRGYRAEEEGSGRQDGDAHLSKRRMVARDFISILFFYFLSFFFSYLMTSFTPPIEKNTAERATISSDPLNSPIF